MNRKRRERRTKGSLIALDVETRSPYIVDDKCAPRERINWQLRAYAYGALYGIGDDFFDRCYSDITYNVADQEATIRMHGGPAWRSFVRYNSAACGTVNAMDLGTAMHRRIMHIDGGDLIHGEVHKADYAEIESRTVKWLADRMDKLMRDAIYGGSYNLTVNQAPTSTSEEIGATLDKMLAPAKSPFDSASVIAIAKVIDG